MSIAEGYGSPAELQEQVRSLRAQLAEAQRALERKSSELRMANHSLDGWKERAEKAEAKLAAEKARADRLEAAIKQIVVLAEYNTTGPGKCKSESLSAAQATSLRKSISDTGRQALEGK